MKLKFIKNENPRKSSSRVLLNRDGRLYFNNSAMREYGLKQGIYVETAINEEDINDKNIYLVISSKEEESAIKVSKAGYLNTKFFFNSIGMDYENTAAYYVIEKTKEMGRDVLKLVYSGVRKRKFENKQN